MANYTPIGSGYTPIGGKAFISPKRRLPNKKGLDRQIALLEQEQNPRVDTRGFGGLADMQAQNAIDPVTNLPVSMSEFDKAQVMANLTKSGEFEAAGLLRNYQQKLPGSAEALMEFRNMRQAQQQFAQRPAAPANPYTPPAQNKPLYVPSGQPQPPSNVPQLASNVADAVGRTMGGPASPQVPSSIGGTLAGAVPPAPRAKNADGTPASWNVNPSLWTPEAMARANPYGANSRPLPTNPNDMRGQARGYGLVSSSGGSSSIAPAGGKVAGWSPTYSGDRQAPVAPPSAALPQNPYPAAPAPFDMQAAVARNRAALDAKYPTDNIKPMNRLERQALSSAINGPTPVASPYGMSTKFMSSSYEQGDSMTNPRTQLAANRSLVDIAKMDNDQASLRPGGGTFSTNNIRGALSQTPSWRDDYLKQNPTPYAAPQGVDLDLPNYSNKNQKMYSQPLLNAANAAGSAAGRYADDQAGRATGADLLRETWTDPMQLRSQAGAAGVSGKLGAFENEYDKWLRYQGGVDKQFDAQSARRKLMIDNLARNPYIR